MTLTHADVRRILDILDHAAHLDSLQITVGSFVLHATKSGALPGTAPAHQYVAAPNEGQASPQNTVERMRLEPPVADAVPEGMVVVRAPMTGTFYKRPQPDQPPFVEEDSWVEEGAPVALLEAMKLFNTIAAPVAGRVVRVPVADGTLVDKDAMLAVINPEAKA